MLPLVQEVCVGGEGAAQVRIGGGHPLALIGGPCVLETEDRASRTCGALRDICLGLGLAFVFKASFDKANRTALSSFRGPGLAEGLAMLSRIRERHGVPVTTDVHEPGQAAAAGGVVDLLQVPAFLCRQTDLLLACARTGLPVNAKKGQFMAPRDMAHVVAKLAEGGARGVVLTERGTTFGYNDLVADMRALPAMRALGVPVCFDATHSVQLPGAVGTSSGGRRDLVPFLARAAAAAGIDALFLEVHEDPDSAPCDGPNMLPLGGVPDLLARIKAIDELVRR